MRWCGDRHICHVAQLHLPQSEAESVRYFALCFVIPTFPKGGAVLGQVSRWVGYLKHQVCQC